MALEGVLPWHLVPRADELWMTTSALREWIGSVAYRLMGYSAA